MTRELTVAGGYYGEFCLEPAWNEFFGPGGRAAAILASRCKVSLSTYCEIGYIDALEEFSKLIGFDLTIHVSRKTPLFRYRHWLSSPSVDFSREDREIFVSAENVVRFGFVEGDAVVSAKKVVYDPQNATPDLFHKNGSFAEEVCVVCNVEQGMFLTGRANLDGIAASLLEIHGIVGVVLKNGWDGAWIYGNKLKQYIPAIPTYRVHKIGSGDVFTAEFAYRWMICDESIASAAENASIGTALYCGSGGVAPIPEGVRIDRVGAFRQNPAAVYHVGILDASDSGGCSIRVNEFFEVFSRVNLKVKIEAYNFGVDFSLSLERFRVLIIVGDDFNIRPVLCDLVDRAGVYVIVYNPKNKSYRDSFGVAYSADFCSTVYRVFWCLNGYEDSAINVGRN